MAKALKALANQLQKNHGVRLIPTFDDSIRLGTVLEVKKWSDNNPLGHVTDDPGISPEDYGPIEGPTPCMLADFRRNHELHVDAALELLRPRGTAKVVFQKASEAVASFESPVTYTISRIRLEEALEHTDGLWERVLGQHLMQNNVFIVVQIIRCKLTFLFRGNGSFGLDLQATTLKNLKSAGLDAKWTWRNESTLESNKEVLLAVEIVRYDQKKKRLVSA